ncbi:MAG: Na/Pi cotransporter family protein [Lachnospiraceae bacterium]|nr:Na/Pi cotransporter family protein [Lachnospiraceae bacterium]
MSITDVINLFSGIALFLFGMSLMGDGLNRVSGSRLEPILYKLTGNPFKGLLLGSGVTAVIQSSSATSVIVMGFVNSNMMKLRQAIPVILGAIFGTSITGWVICLSYMDNTGGIGELLSTSTLTGIIAVTGIIFRTFCKKKSLRHIGDIMMGFAILMFGMGTMSGSVSGLKDMEWFRNLLVSLKNPFLGILVGIMISTLLQSASAAVGIVQALSVTGLETFENSFPLLMGISIGAALPVMVATIGTGTESKRTALSYLVSCVMGVMCIASIFYILNSVVAFSFVSKVMSPFSLAFVNTVFRFLMIVILLPFVDIIEALVCMIIPERKKKGEEPSIVLDERMTQYPALAIEQCRSMIIEMAKSAGKAFSESCMLIEHYSDEGFSHVEKLEDDGDKYEDVLGSFLMKLSSQNLTERQSQETTIFLHTLTDLERISDHALNLAQNAQELKQKQITFSDEAIHELSVTIAAIREILQITISALENEDLELASQVEPLEDVVDNLCDELKLGHVERLQQGKCSIRQGFVFNDMVTNYERISDHCSNIAVALIEVYSGTLMAHEYIGTVKGQENEVYDHYYNEFMSRFAL